MASHILPGVPSAKALPSDRRTPSSLPRPSASRQHSAGSGGAVTSSSRLPQSSSSSFFGRSKGKAKQTEQAIGKVASVQTARPAVVNVAAPRNLSKARPAAQPGKATTTSTTGIPQGLPSGMGVTTDINGGGASTAPRVAQPARSLRRKPSLTGAHERYAGSEGTEPEVKQEAYEEELATDLGAYRDPYPGSIFGITVSPPPVGTYTPAATTDYTTPTEFQTSNSRMELYMSKQLPHKLSTQNLPPPTPNYTSTASAKDNSSASSRYTDSPGPFSRISTPNTSASSYSVAVVTPKLTPPRKGPSNSPTRNRPPVTRRKLPGGTPVEESSSKRGLPSVRENREASNQSSSSSSNSTIKASEYMDPRTGRAIIPAQTISSRTSSKRLPRSQANTTKMTTVETQASGLLAIDERLQSRLPTVEMKSPPARPSRQGTPRLSGLEQTESPIVHSNLTHVATTGHTRRQSMEKAGLMPEYVETFSPRRKLTKTPPQNAATVTSPHLYPARSSLTRREMPTAMVDVPRASKRDPSPASVSSVSSRSRFGLFSRRPKPSEEPIATSSRKGPAAGTGHEAYGRFGRPSRGRSGSTSTSASRGQSSTSERSPSTGGATNNKSRQSSFASNDSGRPVLDEFFEQRLQPVVISGGGAIKDNRNSLSGTAVPVYASSSAQSSVASIDSSIAAYGIKPGVTSSQSSASITSTSASDKRGSRSLLPAPKIVAASGKSSERTLAHRRSQQRISQGDQAVRIPAPINTQAIAPKPVLDSRDTIQSSVLETGSVLTDDMGEGVWLRSGSKDKGKGRSKSKSPRRWNFFSSRTRSRSPKKSTPPLVESAPTSVGDTRQVNVAIADLPGNRFVGHYALMDEEGLATDERSLDDVLRDIEDNLELRDEEGVIVTSAEETRMDSRKISMLLPSPPKMTAEFPRLEPTFTGAGYGYLEQTLERRPSTSQRSRTSPDQFAHRPAQQSFSRPFAGASRPSLESERLEIPIAQTREQLPASQPLLALRGERLPPTTMVEQWRQATYAPAPPTNAFLFNLDGEQEFLTFPFERQDSTSGSSGNTAFMNMLTGGNPQAADSQEDEVWNEYDDLLDAPFSLDSPEGAQMLSAFPTMSSVTRTSPIRTLEAREPVRPGSKQSAHSRKSNSPPVPDKPDYLAIPPQNHPDTNVLHNITSSNTYSEYNRPEFGQPYRASVSSSISGSRYSSQTTISSSSHVSEYTPSPVNQVSRAMARKTHSARDSLRFSALMTSRWLSFDRVLFSPIAEDILSLAIPTPRILILDGLANDDWSAYTSLSYPHATVYNLSTTPKLRTPSPHGNEWANPPNHKVLPLPSLAHPFPFPKGFFAAVVLRFPPLLPQHHLSNIVAEAKRVLRPGGHLELTLLDIDPVNLGPRTRKQVKRVKMRAQERMPDAGLAPVGDATMKLLGRRGFEGLKTAVLGVPVATSPDSNAIQGPGPSPFTRGDGEQGAGAGAPGGEQQEQQRPSRSLGDLLREAGSEGATGLAAQYPVAQTISRVARWWWSRCYEGLASVDGSDERGTLLGLRGRGEDDARSMWADPDVLRECEERETSLRLVLAYAVKPIVVRRRTVSV